MSNINVLTYNISWATQINMALGSEADFVEACQKAYKRGGKQCINNAINNIGKLPKLSLMGLQEVNSDIEKKIMKVQSNLRKFERGKVGLSTVSILWDPDIFGKVIYKTIFNLIDNEDRPCLILILEKDNLKFIIINLHMPWAEHHVKAIKKINKKIKEDSELNKAFIDKDIKIIAMGDFNDPNTLINLDHPLILKDKSKTIKLKYNKTKKQAQKTLKSCCWHEKKHKYKYFSDTGDYILVNKNLKQKSIKIPDIFKKKGRLNRLYSDHTPVISNIII